VTEHADQNDREKDARRNSAKLCPDLELVSPLVASRERPLVHPEDAAYLMAAWAFHHAPEILSPLDCRPPAPTRLRRFSVDLAAERRSRAAAAQSRKRSRRPSRFDVQRGFFEALNAIWPLKDGRTKSTRERERLAYLLNERGATKDDIASAFHLGTSAVEKYVARGRERFDRGQQPLYQIASELISDDEVAEPPDPGTFAGLAELLHHRQDKEAIKQRKIEGEAIEDRRRAIAKAKELGFDLFAAD